MSALLRVLALSIFAGGLVAAMSATPAKADFVSQSACQIANPPANCQGLYASTLTVVVATTEKRVRGTPHAGDCEQPLIGQLDYSNLLANAVKNATNVDKIANFTGDVVAMTQKDTLNFVRKYVGGSIGSALDRNFAGTQTTAVCAPLIVMVPAQAQVVGFRLQAADFKKGFQACGAGSACPIGWSAFYGTPQEVKADGGRAYAVTFSNWSHDTSRTVSMTIFFSSPQPPLTSM